MRTLLLIVAGVFVAVVLAIVFVRSRIPTGVDGPWTLTTEDYPIKVTTVVDGLLRPWSLAFLPNGDMLVTERGGELRLIHNGVLQEQSVARIPVAQDDGRSRGLLDIALHPRFKENGLIYYTYSKPDETAALTLGRAHFDGSKLTDMREIFVSDPLQPSFGNIGSRLAFLPDGTLLMTTGDRYERVQAQNPSSHAGKILRLRDDGTAPPDNPFVGRKEYKPEIYALGHRNSQGLAIHPESGAIYESEHGPRGGDELNRILPGKNYGWPAATYGEIDEGFGTIHAEKSRPGMEEPLLHWDPAIAPSGLAIYTGSRFPKWRDNLFVGALANRATGSQVYRVDLSTKPPHQESLLSSLRKRIRDVRQGPDGLLYILTDEDFASVLRLEPAS